MGFLNDFVNPELPLQYPSMTTAPGLSAPGTPAPGTPAPSPGKTKPARDPRDTPAMRQHTRFKAQHPDCILLFRMGDFYELFFEDAKLASRVLGLTLTERTSGIPMAGRNLKHPASVSMAHGRLGKTEPLAEA